MKNKTHIKYVKAANMWVKSIFVIDPKTGAKKQKQEWFAEKPV